MKFVKPFRGATGGNPYPQNFNIDDECPDDLLLAAKEVGAVGTEAKKNGKDDTDTDKQTTK